MALSQQTPNSGVSSWRQSWSAWRHSRLGSHVWQGACLLLLACLSLQLFFALRIATMVWLDPQSTSFQRSEILRLAGDGDLSRWRQSWRSLQDIGPNIQKAVIASEDAGFAEHHGIEWDAIEAAWERNQSVAEADEDLKERQAKARPNASKAPSSNNTARLVGGSTISQQLAKNLFLSSERTMVRKAQELVITVMLETLLDKRRILEIYLNNVEWGEGIFGIQAAARRYANTDAHRLPAATAARLAVMLPAPKRFEKRPQSAYVRGRAARIQRRMDASELP